ncbi:MAG: hypothetical protein Q9160_006789 [Pyrenula sp. 1 TL-2023]
MRIEVKRSHPFDSIEDSLLAFQRGEFIVVLDSESRENEGDLIIAAEDVTEEKMAFMIRYTSGYICAPLTIEIAAKLSLPLMISTTESTDPNQTAYTVSVDASHKSITTGISAHDRAITCRTLASPSAKPDSFRRPGHVLPLRARKGGVRARKGHTEAAVEFCRIADKSIQVGVICELVGEGEVVADEDGRLKPEIRNTGMLRRDACIEFARRWGLKICTIEDLVNYVEGKEGPLLSKNANGTPPIQEALP